MWRVFAVGHLALVAAWLGAMSYSLLVVQPKVMRFFDDPGRREEFLTVLAAGNRRPVVALMVALLSTGAVVAGSAPARIAVGYACGLFLLLAAAVVFWHVSWRHWPARVFALPDEVPGYQRRLRRLAGLMVALAFAALLAELVVTVGAGWWA